MPLASSSAPRPEAFYSLSDKGGDSLADNQPDKVIRGVVAARSFSGEDIGADDDLALLANDFMLQQTLINRSELLDAEIAIINVFAPIGRALEGEGVNHACHDRVAESDRREQRGALGIEQAAIVWRQPDRQIALVDRAAEVVERRPIARRGIREGIVAVLPAADITAHPLAQPIVAIAAVADRQEVPVLGIEDKQKTVEQDQRGLPHPLQWRVWGCGCDGPCQLGKHLPENEVGQVGGDPLFVEAAFLQSSLMESPVVAWCRQERRASEDKGEDP